ncbi:MAG: hypothetical protein WCY32_01305 [Burkholderiaceae bacterium]
MLSAMLWFRADPADADAVADLLRPVASALAARMPVRFGCRHAEDRPYRTWMLDAGPVAPEDYDALLYRLHRLVRTPAFKALVQGEAQIESFAWQSIESPDLSPDPSRSPDPCA